MGLTYKIQEAMQLRRENQSLKAGASQSDIELLHQHCAIRVIQKSC